MASHGPVGASNPALTATLLLIGLVLAALWAWWSWRRRPRLSGRGVRWWLWNRDRDERFWVFEFSGSIALAALLVGWLLSLLTM